MESKTARLTLLIDPAKKDAFERLCARQDLTPSQVVRQLIRDYLTQHGVGYVPSGPRGSLAPTRAPAGRVGSHPPGAAPAKPRHRG
ncbi:MAG: ribbon-helix-helix protein, CopG family [Caldimonas sp.]